MWRVAPKDEIVASLGGTGPDVALFEAAHLDPFHVSTHNLGGRGSIGRG